MARGAETVILGCTELGMIVQHIKISMESGKTISSLIDNYRLIDSYSIYRPDLVQSPTRKLETTTQHSRSKVCRHEAFLGFSSCFAMDWWCGKVRRWSDSSIEDDMSNNPSPRVGGRQLSNQSETTSLYPAHRTDHLNSSECICHMSMSFLNIPEDKQRDNCQGITHHAERRRSPQYS